MATERERCERVRELCAHRDRLQSNFRRCKQGFAGLLAVQAALLLLLALVNLPGLGRLLQRDLGLWLGFLGVAALLPLWASYWERQLLRALERNLEQARSAKAEGSS